MAIQEWVQIEVEYINNHHYHTELARQYFDNGKFKNIKQLKKYQQRITPSEDSQEERKWKKQKKKTEKELKELNLGREDMESDTGLLHGNSGAVLLAIKTQSPIIPVGIIGADKVLPPETFPRMESLPEFKNTQLKVAIGKPITYEKYYNKKISNEETDLLTTELMKQIGKLANKKQITSQEKK